MSLESLASAGYDLFAFFEMTPDFVCIAGKDGFFKKINPAVINKLGYTEQELFSRPISSFIHPDDKDLTADKRTNLLKGEILLNFQNRYLTKKGKIIWLEWSSIYLPDKEVVFAIAKDITVRKQREKEVEEERRKFKELTSHFKTSIEADRKLFANELHEELAQLASIVKMDVDWVITNEPGLPAFTRSRIENARAITDLLIKTIRRISFSISPGILDDLGLNAALEWHCKEFSIVHGIACRFESEYDEASLGREVKIDFFRICQEAMANVVHHARASKVDINIHQVEDKIILSIIDNGKGFDINQQQHTPGLITMRERAASINAQLTVDSELETGTKVCVIIARQ